MKGCFTTLLNDLPLDLPIYTPKTPLLQSCAIPQNIEASETIEVDIHSKTGDGLKIFSPQMTQSTHFDMDEIPSSFSALLLPSISNPSSYPQCCTDASDDHFLQHQQHDYNQRSTTSEELNHFDNTHAHPSNTNHVSNTSTCTMGCRCCLLNPRLLSNLSTLKSKLISTADIIKLYQKEQAMRKECEREKNASNDKILRLKEECSKLLNDKGSLQSSLASARLKAEQFRAIVENMRNNPEFKKSLNKQKDTLKEEIANLRHEKKRLYEEVRFHRMQRELLRVPSENLTEKIEDVEENEDESNAWMMTSEELNMYLPLNPAPETTHDVESSVSQERKPKMDTNIQISQTDPENRGNQVSPLNSPQQPVDMMKACHPPRRSQRKRKPINRISLTTFPRKKRQKNEKSKELSDFTDELISAMSSDT